MLIKYLLDVKKKSYRFTSNKTNYTPRKTPLNNNITYYFNTNKKYECTHATHVQDEIVCISCFTYKLTLGGLLCNY